MVTSSSPSKAIFFNAVSDFPTRRCGRGGEFANGVKQAADVGVVAFDLALQFGQFAL
jgi:hypothetical protein